MGLGYTVYPRNMHTVFALLCFVVVIHWLIFPYPSGLLHWHCGNLTIAPVPAKQPWWIWINTSCEFIMNDCITTTKQSTTKPCAYFLGYTVCIYRWYPAKRALPAMLRHGRWALLAGYPRYVALRGDEFSRRGDLKDEKPWSTVVARWLTRGYLQYDHLQHFYKLTWKRKENYNLTHWPSVIDCNFKYIIFKHILFSDWYLSVAEKLSWFIRQLFNGLYIFYLNLWNLSLDIWA